MRTSDAEILIVPGWQDSGADHWQTRWEKSLPTARRIVQDDWDNPDVAAWTDRIAEQVSASTKPVVLVGHSLGVPAIVLAGEKLKDSKVAGAFLVAPADVNHASNWPNTGGERWPPRNGHGGFEPMPTARLPFPAVLVASSNDPYCSTPRAGFLADAWGAMLVDAGENGHINVASGHGPWPEGLIRFGAFLKTLNKRPNGTL